MSFRSGVVLFLLVTSPPSVVRKKGLDEWIVQDMVLVCGNRYSSVVQVVCTRSWYISAHLFIQLSLQTVGFGGNWMVPPVGQQLASSGQQDCLSPMVLRLD